MGQVDVHIVEKATGKVVGTFPVDWLGGYQQPIENYFKQAWEDAIDDRLVNEDNLKKYEFRVSNQRKAS